MFREMAGLIGYFVILLGAIIIIAMSISHTVGYVKCTSQAQIMEIEYRYSVFAGCMVKFSGRWMPMENVGVRDINAR